MIYFDTPNVYIFYNAEANGNITEGELNCGVYGYSFGNMDAQVSSNIHIAGRVMVFEIRL